MFRRILAVMILLLLTKVEVQAAFSDDFSDEAVSNLNWTAASESVNLKFSNGSCIVTNKSAEYAGIAAHQIPAGDRKSTFTLSGKISLGGSEMTAGLVCCLSMSGNGPGYYISISDDGLLTVTKISGSSITVLLNVRNPYFSSGANELKVSKKDDLFNIFCNGRFVAKFNDATFNTGDIALLVSAKTTATFDDIVMTDSFEEGAPPTCFADDFNNGLKVEWSRFGDNGAQWGNYDKGLGVMTDEGENLYCVVDISLKQFVMKTSVSQRRGAPQKLYGLFICGTPQGESSSIPLAGFGITGGRSFGVFTAGQSITLTQSSVIRGAPYVSSSGDSTFYIDTLEVIKREGSPEYLFIVNRDTLTRFTGVNFQVTGAGVFCLDNLYVVFDDFIVAEGTSRECSVKIRTISSVRSNSLHSALRVDGRMLDLAGRAAIFNNSLNRNALVPGVYLTPNTGSAIHRLRYR